MQPQTETKGLRRAMGAKAVGLAAIVTGSMTVGAAIMNAAQDVTAFYHINSRLITGEVPFNVAYNHHIDFAAPTINGALEGGAIALGVLLVYAGTRLLRK